MSQQTTRVIVTTVGRNRFAEAADPSGPSVIDITHMAIGDGLTVHSGGETQLYHEVLRKPIARGDKVTGAANTIYADMDLTAGEGPYTIREVGMFASNGDMIAVAHYNPPIEKTLPVAGQAQSGTIRIKVAVENANVVRFDVDETAFVRVDRRIDTATGLAGGGDLSADRTLATDWNTLTQAAGTFGDSDTLNLRKSGSQWRFSLGQLREWLQSFFVQKTGDVMTGSLQARDFIASPQSEALEGGEVRLLSSAGASRQAPVTFDNLDGRARIFSQEPGKTWFFEIDETGLTYKTSPVWHAGNTGPGLAASGATLVTNWTTLNAVAGTLGDGDTVNLRKSGSQWSARLDQIGAWARDFLSDVNKPVTQRFVRFSDLATSAANGIVALASQAEADAATGEGVVQAKHQRRVYAAGGTANALTIAPTIPAIAYVPGQIWYVATGATNTGAVTLAISGMAPKSVRDALGYELPAGSIGAGAIIGLQYDGAQFRIVSGARALMAPFSVVDNSAQALANSITTQLNPGPNGSYSFVGSLAGGVFTFSRPGLYVCSADVTLVANVVGANQISGQVNLLQDGAPAAGAAPNDNNYASVSGGYSFNLSAATMLFVSVGTTVSITGKLTANSNYAGGEATRCSLTIRPVI